MDPFDEVKEDAWLQVNGLQEFVNKNRPQNETKLDFENAFQELQETIGDLRQAVTISEANPDQFQLNSNDISHRKDILAQLDAKVTSILKQWSSKNDPHRPRDVTTMSNRISQDTHEENPFNDSNRLDEEFNAYQQQEVIQNQDLQLDQIHQTMRNLNLQATMMGGELEDQGMMLDDLDQEMDVVGSKLQRGLKRVGVVIEKNKERASDWCIGILVVALCVLLIIVIAI